jgi:energy-coupling factor transporter ATP-binding protein EcfA2
MKYIFKQFKGFRDAELDLESPLTILIGPNGSGKTNAIEGMELLTFLVRGGKLYEITDMGRGGKLEIRGGLGGFGAWIGPDIEMGLSFVNLIDSIDNSNYAIGIHGGKDQRFAYEKLILDNGTMIFETKDEGFGPSTSDNRVRYNNFQRGGRKPIVNVDARQSVLSQYLLFTPKDNKKGRSIVKQVINSIRPLFVFDPSPKAMRNYQRQGDIFFRKDGSNVASVLYSLSKDPNKLHSLEWITNKIISVPEEPFSKIDFVTTQLDDVIFGFKTEDSVILTDATILSDGTLRCLAVLTAVETAPEESLVIIEEFDNGLHPSRLKMLTDALWECSSRRNIKVLVTTHNPATLNGLSNEQLEGVLLCYRNAAENCQKMMRLADLPRYDEVLESGRLGDLVTRDVLSKYLAPDFEEKRKSDILNWLDEL